MIELHKFSKKICKSLCSYLYDNYNISPDFRIGYHSIPSQRPIHVHIISTDYNGVKMNKQIKWNKFNSPFFIDSDILEKHFLNNEEPINYNDNEKYLNNGFYCRNCFKRLSDLNIIRKHLIDCKSDKPYPIYNKDNISEDIIKNIIFYFVINNIINDVNVLSNDDDMNYVYDVILILI